MSWEDATHVWAEQNGSDDGFYVQVPPPEPSPVPSASLSFQEVELLC